MTINFHLALSVLCTIVVIYFTFTYVINPMRDYFYSFCFKLYFKEIEERDKKKKKKPIYLHACYFLKLLISSCSFVFLSGIASLQFEELPLALLVLRVCWL